MKLTVSLSLAVLLTLNTAFSLECHKKADDTFEFREDGEVVEPEDFDCLSVTKPNQMTTAVAYMSDDPEGRKICQIYADGIPKDKKIYSRSEVETGTRCRYSCKDSTGLFKCDTTTTATDNACTCNPRAHSILIQPVIHSMGTQTMIGGQSETKIGGQSETIIGGQSEPGGGEHSCDGKPEGYQFQDPVPCISIRAEVNKHRFNFIRDEPGMCTVEISTKAETRYTRASTTELNLQGCYSVCKMAGPQCITEEDGGKCECESPGVTKRLVAMDNLSVRDVMMQRDCTLNECGPCGECNVDTRECVLHPNAHMGRFCQCGEVCPEVDRRSPDHRGGQILCRPSLALECMHRPGWLRSIFDHSRVGTHLPNMCTKGRSDRADTCSCAPGYIEVPGPFSAMYCTRE